MWRLFGIVLGIGLTLSTSSSEAYIMAGRKPPQSIMNVLARASQEHGIPFSVLRAFADIESGFRPGARTGSYKGMFQLSASEFKRGGGKGSIFNPVENTKAFANIWKDGAQQFQKRMGRAPSGWETYLVHQQGVAGGPAHLRNPDKPAWQNMAATSEGRKKGTRWSKKAIWGNIPAAQKKKFGSVENVTSGQFAGLWKARYERSSGGGDGMEFDAAASSPPLPGRSDLAELPERGMRVPSRATDMEMPERRMTEVPERGERVDPPGSRPKYQYRAAEYETANDIGAGGPPPPDRNPQDAPEPARSAVLPGSPEAGRTGRMTQPASAFGGGGSGFDPVAQQAFGGSFGELYGRKDMGSALLKDVLPSGRPTGVGVNQPPPRPPMFREFFNNMFGGFG